MDSTTSSMLLELKKKGHDNEEIADLYRVLNKKENGPSVEATTWYYENKGKTVSIGGCINLVGVVVGLNLNTSGLYTGDRYPIKVIISEDDRYEYNAIGCTFEYGINQLELK